MSISSICNFLLGLVLRNAGIFSKSFQIFKCLADLQRKTSQNLGAENYIMPMVPHPSYSSYWNGMQPGSEGFMAPYTSPMQMMGYRPGAFPMPFIQGYMLPIVPPQTHRYIIAVCFNPLYLTHKHTSTRWLHVCLVLCWYIVLQKARL